MPTISSLHNFTDFNNSYECLTANVLNPPYAENNWGISSAILNLREWLSISSVRLSKSSTQITLRGLPSSSSANTRMSTEAKIKRWAMIKALLVN